MVEVIFKIPSELIPDLAENLTCQEVKIMALINSQFAKLVKSANLIQKTKMYGFPRTTNRAKIFEFKESEIFDDDYKYFINLCSRFKLTRIGNTDEFTVDYPILTTKEKEYLRPILKDFPNFEQDKEYQLQATLLKELDRRMLIKLMKILPRDITRGDYICLCDNIEYIFDGSNIRPVDSHKNFFIPSEFQIIKNNISVIYWNYHCLGLEEMEDYPCVNFDHRPYQDQMIRNLKIVQFGDEDSYKFQTIFQANNKDYVIDIRLYVDESQVEQTINAFVELFEQQREYIPFTVDGRTEDLLILPECYTDQPKKSF